MAKLMTLDVLSSIKGATSSKAVEELFQNIKSAHLDNSSNELENSNVVTISDLREDKVIESSEVERSIIKGNFPKEKNGYLVVAKVIEN
jgi:Asp-tRNA(Asn)/Glu-tRNA(Gln) amidotransferase C subunit